MSFLGLGPRALGGCSRALRCSSIAVAARAGVPVRQPLRYATTVSKPRAKKPPVSPVDDAAAVGKKTLSTKSSTTATAPKSPRKKKAEAPVLEVPGAEGVVKVPKTRAASTKTSAATKKKDAPAPASPASPAEITAASTPSVTQGMDVGAAEKIPPTLRAPEPLKPAVRFVKSVKSEVAPEGPQPVDTSSPEYKKASRKYTALMVALPILFVTSYYLYDRLVLGNQPSDLAALRPKPTIGQSSEQPQ
ncbi:hypothetical protein B0T26DRAFT_346222 [Lasiosphaeria miniovina]|uniref:Uncharacterized protein n=1 Tax=Lasiosphaeria miniovina TaxID=1954250 RepID=A0AA40ABL1_9PEZI|nr:uncharacterized protein B0T26DRAFT_346222 [Lasiosphaeria miniovina]KAK0712847.1 hypothetical protein B0T26DRAFT_346222 [Lasiosphaeria miniovina]